MMSWTLKKLWRGILDEKTRIRQGILRKRDAIDILSRKARDVLIKERLVSILEFIHAKVIFFFASFRSEVSTLPLIEESFHLGKRVVLPLVNNEAKKLRLYEIEDLSEVSPGFMGIPEPDVSGERRMDINNIDLVIMPGVAFDLMGNRLGYGAGYYDKLLSRLKRHIPLIALAYEEQIVESLPSEPHDIKVHKIVTDRRVIDCRA